MKLIKKYFAGSSLYFNDYLNQYYNITDTPGINTTLFFTAPNLPSHQSINNNIKSNYDFSGIAKEAGKNMYNNDNLNIAASFFLNNGYSKELTAALLANAFYESGGLNNNMMQKGDGTFFGGWQWHKNQMKAGHFSSSDLASQLNYLHEDIKRLWPQKGVKYKKGKRKGQLESHNGWDPKYKKLWDKGGTAALLSKYFSLGYERHTPNAADDARRAKLATSIYNLLVRGTFV